MNPNDENPGTQDELDRAAEQVMQDGPAKPSAPGTIEPMRDISEKLFPSEEARMKNDLLDGQAPAGPSQFEALRSRPFEEPAEPAVFPHGFWRQVDYLLTHPHSLMESMRRDDPNLPQIALILISIAIIMGAIYGAVMGATNFLQGSTLSLGAKVTLMFITAIKVPVLLMGVGAIVYSPIYVSNAFMGERHSWRQVLVLLVSATAITCTVLASMATVAFFFSVTSTTYDFIKLLHVAIFAYAGTIGLQYMLGSIRWMAPARPRASKGLIALWLLLYIFVGVQLAWVLRPFVGSPGEKFEVFRPRSGNFYESVMHSVGKVLSGQEKPPKQANWR
ncbi:hypothetical protein LLG95_15285 [bacterium]|nr:hypothetical protein [bacterium]